ncbi:MAG: type II toxin-antitoxin system RelE/ParE family toxin [Caldilineaceae bacterium]
MPSKRVIHFTIEFKRNIRQLAKKYRHIKLDLQPVIEQLELGETLGDQVPGVGYRVYKVRILNSDIGKGKRAGYRMLYYLETDEFAILLTIYAKSEQEDISSEQIRHIIAEFAENRGN